jgi:hypothetical protein
MGTAQEDKFAAVDGGTALALGDQARAGLALKLGQDCGLLIRIDKTTQHRRLVVGCGDETDERAIPDRRELQTPPRSAST